jgi:hypothetical protein
MQIATAIEQIESKYQSLASVLDERARRHWAATEARAYGWGGVSAVSDATGMSPNTIRKGLAELATRDADPDAEVTSRLRKAGGGRKRLTETDPRLSVELDRLVAPLTRGDPESPLRWTCKSTSHLAQELSRQGHPISARTVAQLLNADGYSLQGNRKTLEGTEHPDRNTQFEYINAKVKRFQQCGQPVISVDTKKKELVGPYKNNGREWQRKGEPERVDVHDFPDPELGKVIPYGVFDMSRNEGWVSVGIDHDTAAFAVQAIGRWWKKMGAKRYPDARELLITADGGGSNGSRCRLWKVALQSLSVRLGLPVHVCPLPARNQQMEQDRASDVLSYHAKLARTTAGESRSHRQSDRQHNHASRSENSCRTGSRQVPHRHQDHRCRVGFPQSQAGQVSRRLELCGPANTEVKFVMLLLRDALVGPNVGGKGRLGGEADEEPASYACRR